MRTQGQNTPAPLDRLFRPKSVAVVGASRRPGSIGAAIFKNLLDAGFTGPVYPINREASAVHSVAAYAGLEALPTVPDLVVVAVPRTEVLAVVEKAAQLGVGGCVIVSAGFAEFDAEGAAVQKKMTELARAAGMRLIGPNCVGIQNSDADIRLDATFANTFAEAGGIAFASQSGALGVVALDYAGELGIGLSKFASLGNKAEVSGNDLLLQFEHDPATRVVALYLESVGNAPRFREIAGRVSRTKPVVMVKSGRSKAGARAVTSHTAALAGPDAAITALCEQTGVIRAETLEELFDVAMLLDSQPLPAGSRVAIVTNAGGPGILAADALETAGLTLPPLSDATKAKLRTVLKPAASVNNPVDVLADASPWSYGAAMKIVLDAPEVDAVLAIFVPPAITNADEVAKAIVEAAAGRNKPVLTCFMGAHGVPEALRSLHAGRLASFRFPEGAARALARVTAYADWRRTAPATPPAPQPVPAKVTEALARARERLGDAGGWLTGREAEDVCRAAGLAMPEERRAPPDANAIVAAALDLGFPLVLKAESSRLVHKTEAGAVIRNVHDAAALSLAVEKLLRLEPDAVLVQRQVSGEEWLIGSVRDPNLGALITVGAGGVRSEIIRDVKRRLAPLSLVDMGELLDGPRWSAVLHGYRNGPKLDRSALKSAIRALESVALSNEVAEVECNPVLVGHDGQGAFAVDARILLRPR